MASTLNNGLFSGNFQRGTRVLLRACLLAALAAGYGNAAAQSWWRPTLNDTWVYQLTGNLNKQRNATVYDIDMYDTDPATIKALQAAGKKVLCYFSAGTAEDWRTDYKDFKPDDLGNDMDDWPGEKWVDTRRANVRSIMQARLDKAVEKGCNGIEADNVDAYTHNSGFDLTPQDQLDYNRFLANESHQRGLAIALKNDVDQLSALVGSFDMAVNEQCHQYRECDGYKVFIDSNKPVFNVEYDRKYRQPDAQLTLCANAAKLRIHTLVLALDLDDSYYFSCNR